MVRAVLIDRKEVNDSQWNDFVKSSPQHCIYLHSWYLDAVCDEWSAIIVTKNKVWIAVMPINSKTKLSVHYLLQPHFTQFMGVAYAGDMKFQKRPYEDYKQILKSIIKEIPENAKLVNFNFHPSVEYLLPFQWDGYDIQVRYTYWLALSDSLDTIRSSYSKSLKNELKLAAKHQLKCEKTNSINELADFLNKRDIISNEGINTLKTLWDKVNANKKGYVLHATDEAGVIHAAAAFLVDGKRLVYFQGSTAGIEKNGGTTFLIDQAIGYAHDNAETEFFDFEGSMIESIEHYFRSFKPTLKTYYSINKNNLPSWIKASLNLKNRLKGG